MSRIEQVNELLVSEVNNFLIKEPVLPNALVTITGVDCSPDLKRAKIYVSVLPDNQFGSALAKLRKYSSPLSKAIKKRTRLRTVPKFEWLADDTEKNAATIDEVFRKIKEEENPS